MHKAGLMEEKFLHFIWLSGNFSLDDLHTTDGEPILLKHRGVLNQDAGPDFLHAEIQIDGTTWAGSVEIHVKSGDWKQHRHQLDDAYNTVVLHVVWEDTTQVFRSDGSHIPTLELKDRVDPKLIENYALMASDLSDIPCSKQIIHTSQFTVSQMLERTAVERIQHKSTEILVEFNKLKGDWNETFYRMLMRNFGYKVNKESFYQLASSIDIRTLAKHKEDLLQIEALLFGQAGLLSGKPKDDYQEGLKKEYNFLKSKYNLKPMTGVEWKFMRMRPANFPTIRIAQFAILLHSSTHLFRNTMSLVDVASCKEWFAVTASRYWENHYRFGEESKSETPKTLGVSTFHNILINTIVPFMFAYSEKTGETKLKERAINFLMNIEKERNAIIKKWDGLGIYCKTAFESQALIQLYNEYCKQKRCLDCGIGRSLIYSVK